jgi:thiol-disulfide isomerase/thioredoxin
MMRKGLVFTAIATLLSTAACGSSSTPVVTGQIVPCISIATIDSPTQVINTDCLDTSKGVNVAAIKGPAIVNVWGSWCEPCIKELPIFTEYFQTMDPTIQLIGVDVEEKSPEDGRMFARTHGIMWPNLYDSDGSTRKYFGMGVPVTWFIEEDGSVVSKHVGPFDSIEALRSEVFRAFGVS